MSAILELQARLAAAELETGVGANWFEQWLSVLQLVDSEQLPEAHYLEICKIAKRMDAVIVASSRDAVAPVVEQAAVVPVVEEAAAPVVEETKVPAPVVEETKAPAPVVEETEAPVVEEAIAPEPVVEEAPKAPAPNKTLTPPPPKKALTPPPPKPTTLASKPAPPKPAGTTASAAVTKPPPPKPAAVAKPLPPAPSAAKPPPPASSAAKPPPPAPSAAKPPPPAPSAAKPLPPKPTVAAPPKSAPEPAAATTAPKPTPSPPRPAPAVVAKPPSPKPASSSFKSAENLTVGNEVINLFTELKIRSKHRFLIFKINLETNSLELESQGAKTDSLDAFLSKLPYAECRFALYDHEWVKKDQYGTRQTSKAFFVTWTPTPASTQHKMLYSTERKEVLKVFTGVETILATCRGDILIGTGAKSKLDAAGSDDDDDDQNGAGKQGDDWMDE